MANLGKFGGRGVGRNGVGWTRTQHSAGGMKTWRIDGIENVVANINAELMEIKEKSSAGLILAAKMIHDDADKTPPKVPVDTNKLRTSTFYTPRNKPGSGDPYLIFGYDANYAAAVHEMMYSVSGKPINWKRPGSGPKFFEASIKRNAAKVLEIIRLTIIR